MTDLSVLPFLMFQGDCQAALDFYCSVFPDAQVNAIERYGSDGPEYAPVSLDWMRRDRTGGRSVDAEADGGAYGTRDLGQSQSVLGNA
jgi:uncharacterized glyoxalase superfamily protein PhnB